MTARGPAPKPAEQKRRLGNLSQHPIREPLHLIEPAVLNGSVPEPLRPLGLAGRQAWDHIFTAGAPWISTTDLLMVQQLTELIDEHQMVRMKVFERPDHRDTWRNQIQLRKLDDRIINALRHLGLTPAERSRLGVAEVRAQAAVVAAEHGHPPADDSRAFDVIDIETGEVLEAAGSDPEPIHVPARKAPTTAPARPPKRQPKARLKPRSTKGRGRPARRRTGHR